MKRSSSPSDDVTRELSNSSDGRQSFKTTQPQGQEAAQSQAGGRKKKSKRKKKYKKWRSRKY